MKSWRWYKVFCGEFERIRHLPDRTQLFFYSLKFQFSNSHSPRKDCISAPSGKPLSSEEIGRAVGLSAKEVDLRMTELSECGVIADRGRGLKGFALPLEDEERRLKHARNKAPPNELPSEPPSEPPSSLGSSLGSCSLFSNSELEITPLGVQKSFKKTKPTETIAEKIYQAYPRHIGKAKAVPAIEKAIETIAARSGWMKKQAAVWLLDRVEKFAGSLAGKRGTFTPYPTTWMNGGRYDDDDAEWQRTDDGPDERCAPQGSEQRGQDGGPGTQRQARRDGEFEDAPIRARGL